LFDRQQRAIMSEFVNSIRAQDPPSHPEGYPFIGGVLAAGQPDSCLIWTPLGWIGETVPLTVWVCAVFPAIRSRGTRVGAEGIRGVPATARASRLIRAGGCRRPKTRFSAGPAACRRISVFHERVPTVMVNRQGPCCRPDRPQRLPVLGARHPMPKNSTKGQANPIEAAISGG